MRRVSLACCVGLLVSACGDGPRLVRVDDGLGTDQPLPGGFPRGGDGRPDVVHDVYAVGAHVSFRVTPVTFWRFNFSLWSVESSDATLMGISETRNEDGALHFTVDMLKAGDATIRLSSSAQRRVMRELRLHAQDVTALKLFPNGPMRAVADPATVPEHGDIVRLATTGKTALAIRLFHGTTELWGTRAVTLSEPADGLTAVIDQGGLGDFHRDFLTLTAPTAPLTTTRELRVGAQPVVLRVVSVRVVDPSTATALVLLQKNEAGLKDGDNGVVIVEGRDATAEVIYGLPAAWRVNGVELEGRGDALGYRFANVDPQPVIVTLGALTQSLSVRSSEARVGTTADKGCAQTGPSGGVLLVLALLLRPRRRA